MFELPKPTGEYPVGTEILYCVDYSRNEDAVASDGRPRELAVQLWYPAQPSRRPKAHYRRRLESALKNLYQVFIRTNSVLNAPAANSVTPFPVILLNHGWGGRRTSFTYLAEDVASHGYVVASIDHTYNAKLVAFPGGRVIRGVAPVDVSNPDCSTAERVRSIWNVELIKWVADQRFVLDHLAALNIDTGSRWQAKLAVANCVAIGHSFGGSAATAACAEDRRVRASVNLDGWFFNALQKRGANQPMLFMAGADPFAARDPQYASRSVSNKLDMEDWADLERSLAKHGGCVVTIQGAAHNDFTDHPLVSAHHFISRRRASPSVFTGNIVRRYVLAFLNWTLHGVNSELIEGGVSRDPLVAAKFWSSLDSRE